MAPNKARRRAKPGSSSSSNACGDPIGPGASNQTCRFFMPQKVNAYLSLAGWPPIPLPACGLSLHFCMGSCPFASSSTPVCAAAFLSMPVPIMLPACHLPAAACYLPHACLMPASCLPTTCLLLPTSRQPLTCALQNRVCRMDAIPGGLFCGNHAHLDMSGACACSGPRVACPVDPTQ